MLRKTIVAVLACVTLFLAKRTLHDGSAHAAPHPPKAIRTASLL